MTAIFFLPFLFLLIWSYAAMFTSLEVYPRLFRIVTIVTGIGGIAGLIAIIIAAAIGVHL